MKKVLIIAVFSLFGLIQTSQAGWPSRVRVVIHACKQIDSSMDLRARLVPGGNFIGEVKPLLYLGFDWKPGKKTFYLEPVIGWNFDTDEAIVALVASLSVPLPFGGNMWTWWDVEHQVRTKNDYLFIQAEYQINDWLHAGIEMEQWKNNEEGKYWNAGMGPNLLLRYGVAGIDIAGHYRSYNNKTDWELVTRFHLFF